MNGKPHLQLYVVGDTTRSARAISNLERIAGVFLGGQCTTKIVDIHANPKAAVEAKIIATPCLVKVGPNPPRSVIGDLSDMEAVLHGLGLKGADGFAQIEEGGERG